jgi:Cu(I)/Ag(I) efflux system periplasmic protein CusF
VSDRRALSIRHGGQNQRRPSRATAAQTLSRHEFNHSGKQQSKHEEVDDHLNSNRCDLAKVLPTYSPEENQMKRSALTTTCALTVLALFSIAAIATETTSKPAPATADAATGASNSAATEATVAEVKKIDRDAKKITLKHEEIKSLDMPPMTMVFHAKDSALFDGLKPGDKVKFRAEKSKSGYSVSSIELMK